MGGHFRDGIERVGVLLNEMGDMDFSTAWLYGAADGKSPRATGSASPRGFGIGNARNDQPSTFGGSSRPSAVTTGGLMAGVDPWGPIAGTSSSFSPRAAPQSHAIAPAEPVASAQLAPSTRPSVDPWAHVVGVSPLRDNVATVETMALHSSAARDTSRPATVRRDEPFQQPESERNSHFEKLRAILTADDAANQAKQDMTTTCQAPYSNFGQDVVSVDQKLEHRLREMQRQIQELTRSSQMVANENDSFEQRMKNFVRQLFEKLDGSIAEVRRDHEDLVQQKDASNSAISAIQRTLVQVCDEVNRNASSGGQRASSQLSVQHEPNAVALKEYMERAAEEMKQGWDQMMDHHRKVNECLQRESRERIQAHEDFEKHLLGLLQKERNDRDMHNAKFFAHMDSVQSDVEAQRSKLADFPALQKSLRALEEKLQVMGESQALEIETRIADPMQGLKALERRFDHIQALIAQESAARHCLAEGIENLMKTDRVKVTNLITQKASLAREDLEELEKVFGEKLDKERKEREAHLDDFQEHFSRHKAAVHDRISVVESDVQNLEQRHQVLTKEVRDLETKTRTLDDHCVSGLRETRRELLLALQDEASQREEAYGRLDEQIGWMGEHHEKMRELVVQRGPRKIMGGASSARLNRLTDGD